MQSKFIGKKKGQLDLLPQLALSIVILVMIVAVGLIALSGFEEAVENDSEAEANIGEGITALGTFGDWYATIIVIGITGVILVLVLTFFTVRRLGGGGRA